MPAASQCPASDNRRPPRNSLSRDQPLPRPAIQLGTLCRYWSSRGPLRSLSAATASRPATPPMLRDHVSGLDHGAWLWANSVTGLAAGVRPQLVSDLSWCQTWRGASRAACPRCRLLCLTLCIEGTPSGWAPATAEGVSGAPRRSPIDVAELGLEHHRCDIAGAGRRAPEPGTWPWRRCRDRAGS